MQLLFLDSLDLNETLILVFYKNVSSINEQLRVSERGDSDNVTALEDLEVALNMTIYWRLVLIFHAVYTETSL